MILHKGTRGDQSIETSSKVAHKLSLLIWFRSASCAVQVACGTCRILRCSLNSHGFIIMLLADEYGTVFLDKAWNADVSAFTHLCKSRMVVTKDYELLQASSLLADVNEFMFRIILIQLLDLSTVRATFHYVDLGHILSVSVSLITTRIRVLFLFVRYLRSK